VYRRELEMNRIAVQRGKRGYFSTIPNYFAAQPSPHILHTHTPHRVSAAGCRVRRAPACTCCHRRMHMPMHMPTGVVGYRAVDEGELHCNAGACDNGVAGLRGHNLDPAI